MTQDVGQVRRSSALASPQTDYGLRDPVTFEVFKNAMAVLADEMGLVMLRTAHSTIANSLRDFSTAICDSEGRVLAQGNTILLHLGTVSAAVTQLVERFAGRIHPGDVFVFNETVDVSQHLPDIYVIRACFVEDRLIGFTVCLSHHIDVGGRVAGGMAADSTEVFEEGIQIPLIKLVERSNLNEACRDLLLQNVRLPELFWGDLEGQMAACYVGEKGFAELARRYSVDGLETLQRELLDYTERLTRLELASIPDGEYDFEDWLDDDGFGGGPVRIRVTVKVEGEGVEVDWTGSASQVRSALNCPMTNTRSVSYGALQGAFGEEIPSNSGFYRAIRVTAPSGTIVNPVRPAAHAARGITTARMLDTLLGALSKALPSRIPAAGEGGFHIAQIAGRGTDGRTVVAFCNSGLESWGGRPSLDGIEGVSPYQSNVAAHSVEALEREFEVRIEQRCYLPDTGGAGRWRGGLGHLNDVRFLGSEGSVVLRWGRRDFRPYGLAGGKPGLSTAVYLNPDSPGARQLPLYGSVRIQHNDVIRMITPGGGGFGDPRERDPEAVRADFVDQKITAAYALREYGVVIDEVNER
jgi:N-methylhydantoinase B